MDRHHSSHTNESAVTRREFVQKSATGVAVSPFLFGGLSSIAATAYVAGSDSIKIGLIGCGGRGSGAAGQALNADPGVILTEMADVFPDRLTSSHAALLQHEPDRVQVEESHKHTGIDGYKKVMDSDVDVVLLVTPPCFRPIHLKAASEAGKHAFCEKPMAIDGPGVRTVLEAARLMKEKKRALVAGFCWRYNKPNREAFAEIHNGRLGAIRAVYVTYLTGPLWTKPRQADWTDVDWQLRNWVHFIWFGGDHICEQACHSIDKLAWAMNGELPTRAWAVGGRIAHGDVPERGDVYDHFAVTYEYASGARGFLKCRQIGQCPGDNSDYILGEKGISHINSWAPPHKILVDGQEPWVSTKDNPSMYQVEHNELFASIRNGQPMNDGEWMAHSTLMAIMGREAAYTGQTVTWDQILNSEQRLLPENLGTRTELPMPSVPIPGKTKFI